MFIPSKMKRILFICLALLAASCTIDKKPGIPAGPDGSKVSVTFDVNVPTATPVPTRAGYGDCDVLNMDVLVFDENDRFLERIPTDRVTGGGASKSFTVRIDPSSVRRGLLVIANARTAAGADRIDMTGIGPGMSMNVVQMKLHTVPLAGGRADEILPLVMSGSAELSRVDDALAPVGVDLTRTAACIQVQAGTPTADNGLTDFMVLGATLGAAASKGMVCLSAGTSGTPSVPSVPGGLTYVDYWTSETDVTGWSEGTRPVLYAYERENSLPDFMSLIVKASWKGRPYYYRILLHDGAGTPYHTVRNHRYIVTVNRVEGPGWPTAAQVAANPPANSGNTVLEVQITDETDGIFNIVTDNQYELGLSNNSFEGWGRSSGRRWRLADVLATHPDASALLTAEAAVGDMSRFRFDPDYPSMYRLYFENPNSAASNRTGSVTVRCGNLLQPIAVRFIESKFRDGYVDKDADSYVFLVADETTPKPWRVWVPILNLADPVARPQGVRLSSSASAAAFTPDRNNNSVFGSMEMESRTSAKAYLHVPASSVYDCTGDWLFLTDGNGETRRIMIMGY